MAQNIILLSGEPRVGKTTAIKNIIQRIGKENCVGFFTEEICNEAGRIGFDCVSLEGDRIKIADVSLESDIRIGRYGIDIDAFECFALNIINGARNTKKVIILDEIGPIQLMSAKFKQELWHLLKESQCILGTIFYQEHAEIDEIKRLPNIKIYNLNTENRNAITDVIIREVKKSVYSGS
jgi:nucleoside-triphosphatase